MTTHADQLAALSRLQLQIADHGCSRPGLCRCPIYVPVHDLRLVADLADAKADAR